MSLRILKGVSTSYVIVKVRQSFADKNTNRPKQKSYGGTLRETPRGTPRNAVYVRGKAVQRV